MLKRLEIELMIERLEQLREDAGKANNLGAAAGCTIQIAALDVVLMKDTLAAQALGRTLGVKRYMRKMKTKKVDA